MVCFRYTSNYVSLPTICRPVSDSAMLTERLIRDALPGPKPHFLWDAQVTGLGCKVAVSGRKTFVLFYRIGRRKRLATLARCSDMSLRDARELARRELTRVRAGEADVIERRRRGRDAPTVNDALEKFFTETVPERIAAGRFTARTAREYKWHAQRYVAPALGAMQVSEVTRHDVEKLASTLADRPSQRNRVLAFVSRIFTLTERWEWRPQHTNPVRGIERAREEPRRRILSSEEFAALSVALEEAQSRCLPSVAAIRVAALTGLRISEVIAMRWADIDLETGRVHLPSTKTGARVHDLPPAALGEVSALPRINAWVFTYGRAASVTYRTMRLHFSRIAASAGLCDVRLHDLRRTFITRAAATGANAFLIQGLLGHQTMQMASRYVQEAGLAVRELRERAGGTVAADIYSSTGLPGRVESGDRDGG